MDDAATIPRDLVAMALDVDAETLPDGDLPLDRFAARFLAFLREADQEEGFKQHPELWTAVLASHLAEAQPGLSLQVQVGLCEAAQGHPDLDRIAHGPLLELMQACGPSLIAEIEAAAETPSFRACLRELPDDAGGALFMARIRAMTLG